MIREYLKTGYRYIFSNKLFSTINILGLTVSLISFILIAVWIKYELSFDNFLKNEPALYRLISDNSTRSPKPLAPVLQIDFPEIISAARFQLWAGCELEKNKDIFIINASRVDNNFFEMFSFNCLMEVAPMILDVTNGI